MVARLQDKKADLLKGVAGRLHDKLPDAQAAMAEAFLEHYYRAVPPAELITRDPLDLYGAALAHLRFAEERRPGHAKIRVYNPQIEQHGWQSTHTVVEVVTDDMPFLVDSASMVLNGHGLLIHLTIHPVISVRRSAGGVLEAVLRPDQAGDQAMLESFMGPASHAEFEIKGIAAHGNLVLTERVDRFVVNGKPVALPVMGAFEVRADGKITAWRDYFDLAQFTKQLG